MKAGSGSMWTKNKGRKETDNRGTTMVTIVISFALLMIFVTAFYKVQKVSQNMMMSAKDLVVNNRELEKAFYLEETRNEIVANHTRLTFSGEEGSFYIEATLHKAQKEGLTGTIFYYESEEEEQENR